MNGSGNKLAKYHHRNGREARNHYGECLAGEGSTDIECIGKKTMSLQR